MKKKEKRKLASSVSPFFSIIFLSRKTSFLSIDQLLQQAIIFSDGNNLLLLNNFASGFSFYDPFLFSLFFFLLIYIAFDFFTTFTWQLDWVALTLISVSSIQARKSRCKGPVIDTIILILSFLLRESFML